MKDFVKKIIQIFFSFIPFRRNYIVFESFPEFSGSPWMIYQEMLKRGVDRKYKLIWVTDSTAVIPSCLKTYSIWEKRTLIGKILRRMFLYRARLIVENNRFIPKLSPKTFRLHAQHGAPLKNASAYNGQIGELDAILTLSENTMLQEQSIFPLTKEKYVILGYPSNDCLWDDVDLYEIGFIQELSKSSQKYSKIIGWLPTFRQHKKSGASSDYVFPFGVPLLKSHDDFLQLNEMLKEKNILLAVQMHHAQAKNFPVQYFSNIVMIPPESKTKYNVSTANLMHNFDAMITDYSAAYHEYLLLDRPIALSIDDYEEYAKNPGFSIDYFDWIKGVYLKNVTDLMKFIDDVANGIDSAKKERESAMHRIHKYTDNHSTQRVVDFLIEKANL